MADLIVILVLCVLGLAAHAARNHGWIEWTLRVIYGFACVAELYTVFTYYPTRGDAGSPWAQGVTLVMAVITGMLLFRPLRNGMSHFFTAINFVVGGGIISALMRQSRMPAPALAGRAGDGDGPVGNGGTATATSEPAPHVHSPVREAYLLERIFVPTSIPHMNGLWIYVTTLGCLLANISPDSWSMPMIGIPFPAPVDSLFTYNLFGLVLLAACGCGIIVARGPKAVMVRLGIVKPQGWHYGIAFLALLGTFVYDYIWSIYTGTPQSGVGAKLGQYNSGTFSAGGGAGPAAFLAIATAVCAGIGEETLMRGGLQAVFGIVPAGMLHGILHGQFNHMPLLMIQIGVWSCMLGIVRKYTNTTTTIIVHAAYNFINTFLFAFNP